MVIILNVNVIFCIHIAQPTASKAHILLILGCANLISLRRFKNYLVALLFNDTHHFVCVCVESRMVLHIIFVFFF